MESILRSHSDNKKETKDAKSVPSSASTGEERDTPPEENNPSKAELETPKMKGILKSPEKITKYSYGFKERLDLDESMVAYGSMLQRSKTELHQDNRLCEKYGLEPNIGCVYKTEDTTSHGSNSSSPDIDQSQSKTPTAKQSHSKERTVRPKEKSRNQSATQGPRYRSPQSSSTSQRQERNSQSSEAHAPRSSRGQGSAQQGTSEPKTKPDEEPAKGTQ